MNKAEAGAGADAEAGAEEEIEGRKAADVAFFSTFAAGKPARPAPAESPRTGR